MAMRPRRPVKPPARVIARNRQWFRDSKYVGMAAVLDFNAARYALPALGPELANLAAGYSTSTGTATAVHSNGTVTVAGTDASNSGRFEVPLVGLTAGKFYQVLVRQSGSIGFGGVWNSPGQSGALTAGGINGQTNYFFFTAADATDYLVLANSGAYGTVIYSGISVKEVQLSTLRSATRDEVFSQFTASSTAARTYVDASGVMRTMEYGRTNYLVNSNTLSGYSLTGASVIANDAIAPDGTMTAPRLTATSTNGQSRFDAAVSTATGGTYTLSAHVKANTANYAAIGLLNGANQWALFNLSTGTVTGNVSGMTGAAITPVGSGWYRISAAFVAAGASVNVKVIVSNGVDWFNAATGDSIHTWGIQLEPDPELTAYKPTTATPATGANAHRYDWSTGKRRLLLENQATNLLLWSEDLASGWTVGGVVTRTANTHLAPNGTQTADTLNLANSGSAVFQNVTLTATSYTMSCWVRSVSGTGTFRFNYYNGTSNTSSADLAVTTEWQRFTFTFTGVAAAGNVALIPGSGGAAVSLAAWGAQVEASSFASSYIPTQGSAVTRAIESFRLSPLVEAILQRAEGGVVVRGRTDRAAGNPRIVGGTNSSDALLFIRGVNTQVGSWNNSAELWQTLPSGTTATGFGAVVAFDGAGRALAANGSTVISDIQQPSPRLAVYLGRDGVSSPYADGHYDFLGILATRPSNATLQALAVPA